MCFSVFDCCHEQNNWIIDKADFKYVRENPFSLSIESNILLVNETKKSLSFWASTSETRREKGGEKKSLLWKIKARSCAKSKHLNSCCSPCCVSSSMN